MENETIPKKTNNYKNVKIPEQNKNSSMSEKLNLPDSYYKIKTQRDLIKRIFSNEDFEFSKPMKSLIKKKLSSYRQQDREKKILRKETPVITFDETIEKLVASKLCCFYCKCKVFIFYKKIRDNKQWTLDRIDNSIGHCKDNVLISCLECNLKRRTMEMDRFTFTKQLRIKKSDTLMEGEKSETEIDETEIDQTEIDEIKVNETENSGEACEKNDKDPSSDIKVIKSIFF